MGKAVLLDIDGTLLDSNDQHARSWVDALKAEGLEAPYERIRSLIGMGGDRLLPAVTGIEESSEQGKRIAQRRAEIFREKYLPELKPFPATRELVQRFKNEGYQLVVATSSGRDLMRELLRRAGVDDLIEEHVTKDDADASKPDPDIVRSALGKSGVEPRSAIMLGDTPYDIIAATRAGVRAIAFTCGGWNKEDLAGAVAVFDGPADLLARWSQSPFGK